MRTASRQDITPALTPDPVGDRMHALVVRMHTASSGKICGGVREGSF